jgi:flagellar hook-associated protein 3 FlgL
MERISTNLLFQRGTSAMLEQQAKLSQTEIQLATGKRILTPKDDPAGSAYLLDLSSTISRVEQYQDNSDRARARLEMEEAALNGMDDLMPRILELTIQGINDSNTANDREAIAAELRQLNDELFTLANTRDSNGEYIFAGFDADTIPFTKSTNLYTGAIDYSYQGDMGVRSLQISDSRQVQDRDNGFDLFMNIDAWSPTTITGVAATTFGALADGDITLNSGNAAGTVSLGAIPAAADAAERASQLRVAINALTSQTGIRAENPTADTLELISNTDSDVILNLSGAADTASTGLTSGTYSAIPVKRSLFESIDQIIQNLEADTPSTNQIEDIHLIQQHLLDFHAGVGTKLNTIENQATANDDFLLSMKTARSEVEDLDYAEAVSRFQQQLLALQAAQQSFAKIQGLSLFDYL